MRKLTTFVFVAVSLLAVTAHAYDYGYDYGYDSSIADEIMRQLNRQVQRDAERQAEYEAEVIGQRELHTQRCLDFMNSRSVKDGNCLSEMRLGLGNGRPLERSCY